MKMVKLFLQAATYLDLWRPGQVTKMAAYEKNSDILKKLTIIYSIFFYLPR